MITEAEILQSIKVRGSFSITNYQTGMPEEKKDEFSKIIDDMLEKYGKPHAAENGGEFLMDREENGNVVIRMFKIGNVETATELKHPLLKSKAPFAMIILILIGVCIYYLMGGAVS